MGVDGVSVAWKEILELSVKHSVYKCYSSKNHIGGKNSYTDNAELKRDS